MNREQLSEQSVLLHEQLNWAMVKVQPDYLIELLSLAQLKSIKG